MLLLGCAPAPERLGWASPDQPFKPRYIDVCPVHDARNCALATPFRPLINEVKASPKNRSFHYVNLLEIGEEALLLRLHLIRSAQKSIYIQQYIWASDVSGLLIFRELVEAARRGVEIKIIGDQISTVGDAGLMASMVMAHRNLEFKIYNPTSGELESSYVELALSGLVRLSGVNQRMHNKLMLVDEEIAVLGGRNHEDRYFDLDEAYNFKDRDILVIGPVVRDMVLSFFEFWNYEYAVPAHYLKDVQPHLQSDKLPTFESASESESAPELENVKRKASSGALVEDLFVSKMFRVAGRVTFYADSPGKPFDGPKPDHARPIKSSYQGIYEIGFIAKDNIVLQTPYLILTEEAFEGLRFLRARHPNLQIIASTNSLASIDHFLAYSIMIKQRKRLLQILGLQVFEFKPVPGDVRDIIPRYDQLSRTTAQRGRGPKEQTPAKIDGPIVGLHGKSVAIDDRIAFVGSHNFDPRSEIFDTQIAIAIWDQKVATALKANILRDTEPQNSWVVARQQKLPVISSITGVIESISRSLPVLDVWPFNYSANFELREGEEPVPPDHPMFYERYINRGQFPDVDEPEKVIQTVLTRYMGGFATPVM